MKRLSSNIRRACQCTIATGGLSAIALGGCGGGQGTTPPRAANAATTPAPVQTTGPQTSVVIRVDIPPSLTPGAVRRRPAYVSPATNSITFAQNGTLVATLALTVGSPNCTPTSGGGRTCMVNASAASGPNQVLTVQTFASGDGTGTPLSRQTISATITLGAVNPLSMTLNGVVASITAAFASSALPYGVAGSTALVVNARDVSGATIVGPGSYVDAAGSAVTITLTNADGTGGTALGATSLTQPGAPPGFTYAGNALAGDTVTASAPGISAAAATIGFSCSAPSAAGALYVADGASDGKSRYSEYPLSFSGGAPAPRNVVNPPGLVGVLVAVDAQGRVYIPEGDDKAQPFIERNVAQFCPQATGTGATPYRTIVTPSTDQAQLSISTDAARDLYLLVRNSGAPVIREYGADAGVVGFAPASAPDTPTLRTIGGSATTIAEAELVAANGNVYTGTSDGVIVFGPTQSGNVAPASTIVNTVSGLTRPVAMTYDPLGYLYVLYAEDRRTALSPGAYGQGAIAEFAPGSHTTPIRVISGPNTGIHADSGSGAIATDGAGNLYFLDSRAGRVERFNSASYGDSGSLAFTFSSSSPYHTSGYREQMALDPSTGNIYICDSAGSGVLIYSSRGRPVGQILPTTNGIGRAFGIVFDISGSFVVLSYPFKDGATTYGLKALEYYPAGTIAAPAGGPSRIVNVGVNADDGFHSFIDRDSLGDIFVHVLGGAAEYASAAAPNDPPIATFVDPNLLTNGISISGGEQVAVDPSGVIALMSETSETVYLYPSGTSGPNAVPTGSYFTFLPNTRGADLFATDAAGNVYVGSRVSPSIEVFPPGATTPNRTIYGPHTRLNLVKQLAVDGAGNLYVGNQDGNAILVFGPTATGDAAPSRIMGGATNRINPWDHLAVGPGGVGAMSSSRNPSAAAMHGALSGQGATPLGPFMETHVAGRQSPCKRLLRDGPPVRGAPAPMCNPIRTR